jgi:hypothetical protein
MRYIGNHITKLGKIIASVNPINCRITNGMIALQMSVMLISGGAMPFK